MRPQVVSSRADAAAWLQRESHRNIGPAALDHMAGVVVDLAELSGLRYGEDWGEWLQELGTIVSTLTLDWPEGYEP